MDIFDIILFIGWTIVLILSLYVIYHAIKILLDDK